MVGKGLEEQNETANEVQQRNKHESIHFLQHTQEHKSYMTQNTDTLSRLQPVDRVGAADPQQ